MTQVTQQLSQRDSPGFPRIMNSFPLEGKEHKTNRAFTAHKTPPYGYLELLLSRSEPPLPPPASTLTLPCRLGCRQRGKSSSPAPREAVLILGQAWTPEALPGSPGPPMTVRSLCKSELSLDPSPASPSMLLYLSCLRTFKAQPNVTPSTAVFLMSSTKRSCTPYYDTLCFLLSAPSPTPQDGLNSWLALNLICSLG